MSKFKVGQKWRARNGEVFEIIKDSGDALYPIRAKLKGAGAIISVERDGRYASEFLDHECDLVELVFDPDASTCSDSPTPKPAAEILRAAMVHLDDRAQQHDSPQGERSMGATVEAFRAVTGVSITETQGWLFMALLKAVRSQQGDFKLDSYEDGAAYFALAGEAASK